MKINKFFIFAGFFWYLSWILIVAKSLGKTLEAPPLNIFDIIIIPIITTIIPYWFGAMTFYGNQ